MDFHQCDERTARSEHRCHDCDCDILPGTQYWDSRFVADGSWSRHKVCAPCMDLRCRQLREEDCYELPYSTRDYVWDHAPDQIVDDEGLLGFAVRSFESADRRGDYSRIAEWYRGLLEAALDSLKREEADNE